ncbi:MAG: bifunctional UDP-N-acetylglucosamine diphosphorylase/glucosamine-1-phosphate N-acetyltransferase GlmU [Candidatus Protistobacter heckmanni]|nr:bifunctional UDP-N-acetylglucosamine diphosphorylase/glucosamine-1-phosphate N-acetyltransferase GlmU [Candidatus Protistobacter heckmanni]
MNIVILAAGQGKRMQSALPKVLHPIAGKPMALHVLDTARKLSPKNLVMVVGTGADAVRAACAADDLRFAEQAQQLGTGHAVMQAMSLLASAENNSATLVLYADVPLIAAASTGDVAVLTVEMDDPTGYGRIVREGAAANDGRNGARDGNGAGAIVRIVEQKDASPEEKRIREINTGIVVFPTAFLAENLPKLSNQNAQGEYYLTDLIALAVQAGIPVVSAQPADAAETMGVNSKTQLADVERAYQLRQARALTESGVTLADPARIDVRGSLRCGRDVRIDINAVFEGKVELCDGVSIGPNCVLSNCRVAAGAQIKAYSHIDGASVGKGNLVGPYARLRPGADLGEDVHIGNFVEVKASSIDDQSKANHLAYIGDAEVGKRVNIGAGTITCNYDGVNKHRTVIGDDAFIGSDSQLVAPVTVGRGATLGAGTTLTKDAPADKLTVSRAKQLTIDAWRRPEKKPK